jgi:NAD(P)-dependent dehydrogenase (short-subunit alcohol dehydrogenase family)
VKLEGKRAVITGASQGLGLAMAEAFLKEGASVMICARGAADLERAVARLEATIENRAPGRVHAMVTDIGVEAEIDALAEAARARMGGTDIFVANAGIHGPKGSLEEVDWQEWVDAIRINLTGTVYGCRAFLPQLRKSARGKILILSGGGATKPFPFISAYAASKAGIVRFGETLAHELMPAGIDVNMIAPGALNTRLLYTVLEAGPEKVGEAMYQASLKQQATGGNSIETATALCVYLASAASDGVTGRLISAQWDPWQRLSELKDELAPSDIYTLRRIVPAERGKDWDRK